MTKTMQMDGAVKEKVTQHDGFYFAESQAPEKKQIYKQLSTRKTIEGVHLKEKLISVLRNRHHAKSRKPAVYWKTILGAKIQLRTFN